MKFRVTTSRGMNTEGHPRGAEATAKLNVYFPVRELLLSFFSLTRTLGGERNQVLHLREVSDSRIIMVQTRALVNHLIGEDDSFSFEYEMGNVSLGSLLRTVNDFNLLFS